MSDFSIYEEYCTGCGLCCSVLGTKFVVDNKGFNYPIFDLSMKEFCSNVCPASGELLKEQQKSEVWGHSEACYLGYAVDDKIRKKASSGGVLTELCCFLLDAGVVDGIIQTKISDNSAIMTKTVISTTKEEVIDCSGSRYAESNPLMRILQQTEEGKKYVFIGKPCDVASLKQYMKTNHELKKRIIYLFSFFCMGVPSKTSNKKLLFRLNCNESTCESLSYRGNGWPGNATAVNVNGTRHSITYNESWGEILGRDLRKCCRFCMDGLGEAADVSCGDGWYLDNNNCPDFSEHAGRNIVFARTTQGNSLLLEAMKAGYINIELYTDYRKELKLTQYAQYQRKVLMAPMMCAMKLCGKKVPKYNFSVIVSYCKDEKIHIMIKRFLGTIKRIIKKRI